MIFDMSPTSVGKFILATGAAAGWLMTATVTRDEPDLRSDGSVARPAAPTSVPPAGFTGVLRDRMRQPAAPERGRNPFSYGPRHSAARQDAPAAAPELTPAAPAEVEPAGPVFRLSGIAASREDDTTVLTAIVIDNGTMVFVKTGDALSNGYSVVRVDETSITLADAAGVTQTLRLP